MFAFFGVFVLFAVLGQVWLAPALGAWWIRACDRLGLLDTATQQRRFGQDPIGEGPAAVRHTAVFLVALFSQSPEREEERLRIVGVRRLGALVAFLAVGPFVILAFLQFVSSRA